MRKILVMATMLALSCCVFATEVPKDIGPVKVVKVDLAKIVEMAKPKIKTETVCFSVACERDEARAHRVDALQKKTSTIGPVYSTSYDQLVPGTDGDFYDFCYLIRWTEL